MKNIILIGMPGSGKSTVGYLLSEKLNLNFIDMDDYIEKTENKSIKELFEISENNFRDAETRCSYILSKTNSNIIAAGGGIVKRKENIDAFEENSIIIFLNRPIEDIIQDIETKNRPLLKDGKEKLHELYKERLHLYKQYCHIEILNNKTALDAVDNIYNGLLNYRKSGE